MALMHTQDNCGPQTSDILTGLVEKARRAYPDAEIVGHCELPGATKPCPCYKCSREYADLQPK